MYLLSVYYIYIDISNQARHYAFRSITTRWQAKRHRLRLPGGERAWSLGEAYAPEALQAEEQDFSGCRDRLTGW